MNAVPPPLARQTVWDRLPAWSDPVLFAVALGLLATVISIFFYSVATFGGSGMLDGILGGVLLMTISPLFGIGCAR